MSKEAVGMPMARSLCGDKSKVDGGAGSTMPSEEPYDADLARDGRPGTPPRLSGGDPDVCKVPNKEACE